MVIPILFVVCSVNLLLYNHYIEVTIAKRPMFLVGRSPHVRVHGDNADRHRV